MLLRALVRVRAGVVRAVCRAVLGWVELGVEEDQGLIGLGYNYYSQRPG